MPENEEPRRSRRNAPRDDGRTTLNDVCRAAGVSKATVSRVLNNRPGVGRELRARVMTAIEKLDYTPRAAARNLSLARSDTIGVVFQDLTPGFLLNVFRGVMHVASATRYNVITALSTMAGDELELPNRLLAEGRADGLVWYDPRVPPEAFAQMQKRGLRFVVVQRYLDSPAVNSVAIENTHGAYQAVTHLLKLGHRRVMLVTGHEDNEDSQQRLRGAVQAFREFNVEPPRDLTLVGHNVGVLAVRAFSDYLDRGKPLPEAIFAFNDDMAIALMIWLRRQGTRVPEEIAIVGFDGINEAEYFGLTTVETPMYEMGVLAAQILLDQMSEGVAADRPRQVLLRGNLRVRDSCGAKLKQPPKGEPS